MKQIKVTFEGHKSVKVTASRLGAPLMAARRIFGTKQVSVRPTYREGIFEVLNHKGCQGKVVWTGSLQLEEV